MTSLAIAVLAPPSASRSTLSTAAIVIIVAVAVVGLVFILGWKAPDRSPKIEEKVEREEEE